MANQPTNSQDSHRRSFCGHLAATWTRISDWFGDLVRAVSRCRYCVYTLLVAFILFGVVPQGVEAVASLSNMVAIIAAILLTVAWSIILWLVSRRMLTVPLSPSDHYLLEENERPIPRHVRWLPRYFAILAFGPLLIAAWRGQRMADLGIYVAVAAVAFTTILVLRRPIRRRRAGDQHMLSNTDYYTPFSLSAHIRPLKRFFTADKETRRWWFVLIPVVLWGVIARVLIEIIPTTNLVNAAHVLTMQLIVYTLLGSLGFYLATRARIPVMPLLILGGIIASCFNDNHDLRITEVSPKDTRCDLATYTDTWLKARTNEERKPLVIVVSKGGGIRAAYWTAAVLQNISSNDSVVRENMYALTSVSGGSFGCASYLAGQADDVDPTKFLRQDFLTPGISALLERETLQHLIPTPILSLDRSRPFENGFDFAWGELSKEPTDDNTFSRSFLSFWSNKERPLLILNTTLLETGQRTLISPVRLPDSAFPDANQFFSLAEERYLSIPMSTAVHASARFPYFSAAGTFTPMDCSKPLHLLDGGYFDNSGSTTAFELLEYLRANPSWRKQIVPIVISLTNSSRTAEERVASDRALNSGRWSILHEWISPPRGVYGIWDAHTYHSTQRLKSVVESWDENTPGFFFEASLNSASKGADFVLGWSLSRTQKRKLKKASDSAAEDFQTAIDAWRANSQSTASP